MHVFTSFVLFEGEKFHGGGRVWYFNVIWLKSIHTFTFIVTVFTASASIRVSARNASLYIAVMIFCAQPYLKPCFMCPFYILSTCPSKGLCSALLRMSVVVIVPAVSQSVSLSLCWCCFYSDAAVMWCDVRALTDSLKSWRSAERGSAAREHCAHTDLHNLNDSPFHSLNS